MSECRFRFPRLVSDTETLCEALVQRPYISRNALSIAFASAGVMNDDITAQATASRQIAQRLRSCRRNCPTTAARRSAALLRLTVSAKGAVSDRTVEKASGL